MTSASSRSAMALTYWPELNDCMSMRLGERADHVRSMLTIVVS